ncbi:MAG: glycoside hydrolase family 43 protein [Eubacterium sp.]
MKKSASKKILSLFLAVLMLASCIPAYAYTVPSTLTDDTATVSKGYFNHANAHDPTIVSAYEITATDGKVYNFPLDYIEKNKKGYTTWDSVYSAYGIDSPTVKKVYWIFGTHFDNEKSYDLKNWEVVSDLSSITMFGSQKNSAFSTDVDGTILQYGTTGVSAATLRANYPEYDLMCSYAKYADGEGSVWAADMVFNYAMDCWTYYGSCSAGQQTETIFYATSQRLDGGFIFGKDANDHTDCFVLVGGFATSDWPNHPFLDGSNCAEVFKTGAYFGYTQSIINANGDSQWDNTSTTSYPGYIDPCVFYDANGNLWMVYGSHANGIFCLQINESTGIADFAKTWANGANYTNNGGNGPTKYDRYSGVKIANSDSASNGEGAYVVYSNGVYVLSVTYGNLDVSQGYTIKTFTSTSPDGPYYDAAGNIATSDSSSITHSLNALTVGSKQMGDYSFSCNDYSYSSPGHNSMFTTDTNGDGIEELFNVYHSRYIGMNYYNDGNGGVSDGSSTVAAQPSSGNAYYFNDFVHRAYVVPTAETTNTGTYGTNSQTATVTMPYEYSGEQMTDLKPSEIQGAYKIINHGNSVSTSVVTDSNSININTDGTVAGYLSGTWKNLKKTVNGKTYPYDIYRFDVAVSGGNSGTLYGVFMKQYDETSVFKAQQGDKDNTNYVVTFSLIGTNNTALWGSKKPAPAATDTNNSPYSQLSVSPQIYVSGGDGTDSTTVGLDMFGTKIYQGSYNGETYTSYLYISKDFTINSVTEYGTSAEATPANIVITEDNTYSDSSLKRYILSGDVSSDFKGSENAIMLTVSYKDADGTEYKETMYSFVMQTPVPAHEYGSAYRGGTGTHAENSYMISAPSSYGSVTTNVQDSTAKNKSLNFGSHNTSGDGTGDSSYIITPSKCEFTILTGGNSFKYNNVSHTADIITGLYSTSNPGDKSGTAYATQNAEYTPVVASYYFDLSDLSNGTNVRSRINADKTTYTLKATLFPLRRIDNDNKSTCKYINLYDASGYKSNNQGTANNSILTLNTNAVGTIGTEYSSQDPTYFASALVGDKTTINYKKSYDITLTGKFEDGSKNCVLAVDMNSYSNKASFLNSDANYDFITDINYKINVYDKSLVRDVLNNANVDENGNHLVAANYTIETWTAYQEALKNAYDYCNNYKQVPDGIDNDSNGKNDYEEQIANALDAAYKGLLSIDDYTEAGDTFTEIENIIKNPSLSEIYTTDTLDEFNAFYEANKDKYGKYVKFDTTDATASDFWREIDAAEKNYDQEASSSSKADYDAAIAAMKEALNKLRLHVDDTDLNSIISTAPTTINSADGKQYYTYAAYADLEKDLVTAKDVSSQYNEALSYSNTPMYQLGYEGDTTKYTAEQTTVNDETGKITNDIQRLRQAASDTSPYDALVDIIEYQDIGAFKSDYFSSSDSIFGIIKSNGSNTGSVTYDYGVSSDKAQTCDTPSYTYGMDTTCYVIGTDSNVYINSSQDGIDNTVTMLQTEINTANDRASSTVLNEYTVSLIVNCDGTENPVSTETYKYGQQFEYTPDASFGTCYKWSVKVGDANAVDIPSSSAYSFNVHDNTVITCYTSTDTVASDTVKVRIENIYGIASQEYSLNSSYKLVLSDGACSITDTNSNVVASFNAEVVPFYYSAGWHLNSRSMNYGTYTLADVADENSTVVLRPTYNVDPNAFDITFDSTVINAVFDGKVSLTSSEADAYAIAYFDGTDYYVVNYGNSYDFYATAAASFVTITKTDSKYYIDGTEITDADLINSLDSKLPFASSIGKKDSSSFTIFSAPSLNAGVEITEMGTVYASSTVEWNDSSLVIGGTSGGKITYKIQAKNPDELAQQYFLKINSTAGIVARSYVKYSYTVNGTTIQTIAYGNIVSSN